MPVKTLFCHKLKVSFEGEMEGHYLFNDLITGSTLCLPIRDFTPQNLINKVIASREKFGVDYGFAF